VGKPLLERVKEVPTPPELLLDWPSQHKDPDERDDEDDRLARPGKRRCRAGGHGYSERATDDCRWEQQGDENPPLRIVTLDRSASESAHSSEPIRVGDEDERSDGRTERAEIRQDWNTLHETLFEALSVPRFPTTTRTSERGMR